LPFCRFQFSFEKPVFGPQEQIAKKFGRPTLFMPIEPKPSSHGTMPEIRDLQEPDE
jgi:hypothetical protein